MIKPKEIQLGIGYTINDKGQIVGCSEDNYQKKIYTQYEEIIAFLLTEYAKSNCMNTKQITFI